MFAHGSLTFLPPRRLKELRPASVVGYERRMGHPSVRNWGIPGSPAPTSCLVPGSMVYGAALRLPLGTRKLLVRREASQPTEVEVTLDDGTMVPGLTWKMSTVWADQPTAFLVHQAVRNIDVGGGPFGDALEYATGLQDELAAMDRPDSHLDAYLELLTSYLDPPRPRSFSR